MVKGDSLILATQVRKVFYLPDTKFGNNWQVVQTFDHRHLYNVSETSIPFSGPAYQEEDCCDQEEGSRQIVVDESTTEMPLNRHDEPGQMFEGSEIARLRKERPTHVCQSDSEDDDEDVDDTIEEYCSEDDVGATVEVDSDDE